MQIDNLLLNVLGHFEVSVVLCLLRFVGKEDHRGLYSSPDLNEMGPGQQPTREDEDSGRICSSADNALLGKVAARCFLSLTREGKLGFDQRAFFLFVDFHEEGRGMDGEG